jgi:hypothetical protein
MKKEIPKANNNEINILLQKTPSTPTHMNNSSHWVFCREDESERVERGFARAIAKVILAHPVHGSCTTKVKQTQHYQSNKPCPLEMFTIDPNLLNTVKNIIITSNEIE